MRRMLTSGVLCAVALCAGAQYAMAAPAQAAQQDQDTGLIKTASAGTAEAQLGPRSRDALVNVAAAHAAGIPSAAAAAAGHKPQAAPEEERRRRTGPAMLIAALAVMFTIALRRLGAFDL
jgi:hypothetical protein